MRPLTYAQKHTSNGLVFPGHACRAGAAVAAGVASVAAAVRRRAASCRRVGVVQTARAL